MLVKRPGAEAKEAKLRLPVALATLQEGGPYAEAFAAALLGEHDLGATELLVGASCELKLNTCFNSASSCMASFRPFSLRCAMANSQDAGWEPSSDSATKSTKSARFRCCGEPSGSAVVHAQTILFAPLQHLLL